MSGEPPLARRRALVTGAATGIGRATAARLARDGAAVCVNHLGDPDAKAAGELVHQLEGEDLTAFAAAADVSDERQVGELFDRAASVLGGPVDLLVNNAGVEAAYALVDMPLEEWERVLSVNLTGPFLCARAMARALLDGRERVNATIVNVTSVHERIPWPSYSHYCASKGGLKLFGETIARELGPHGIRVVQVGPGAIMTPINRTLAEDEQARQQVIDEIPLGRLGEPDEIAAAVSWAAGPGGSYLTGSTIFVDGGMTTYPKFV